MWIPVTFPSYMWCHEIIFGSNCICPLHLVNLQMVGLFESTERTRSNTIRNLRTFDGVYLTRMALCIFHQRSGHGRCATQIDVSF